MDPDLPDLYLRGGAIVPTGPVMNYVDEKALDPLTLLICLDADGKAAGKLYEDAGDGFGYQSGDYLLTTYQALREKGAVMVSVRETEGKRPRPARRVQAAPFPGGRGMGGRRHGRRPDPRPRPHGGISPGLILLSAALPAAALAGAVGDPFPNHRRRPA